MVVRQLRQSSGAYRTRERSRSPGLGGDHGRFVTLAALLNVRRGGRAPPPPGQDERGGVVPLHAVHVSSAAPSSAASRGYAERDDGTSGNEEGLQDNGGLTAAYLYAL